MSHVYSIVRIKEPGHPSSYPVGRQEVYFLAPYNICQHSVISATSAGIKCYGRDDAETLRQAEELCRTYNACRYDETDNRLRYVVEIVGEESPDRAPLAPCNVAC